MRKLVIAVLLPVLMAMRAADLPPDLARAVSAYDRAQFGNDVQVLGRLVTDDYVLVNSDGTIENKHQFLADFLLPGFRIEPYVVEDPVQKVWADGAVLGGLVHLRWTQDGKRQTRDIRVVYVWAKSDGAWRVTYTQVTRA